MNEEYEGGDDLGIEDVAGARTTAAEEARGVSLLQEAEHEREHRDDTLYLDIPSWGGDLIGAYRPIERTRLETMIRKIMKETRKSRGPNSDTNARTAADIDLITATCIGIYARDPGWDGREDAEESRVPVLVGSDPATYGTINEVLRKPQIRSQRDAVLYLFAKPPSEGGPGGDPGVPISAHALTIARYMRDPSKDPTDLE